MPYVTRYEVGLKGGPFTKPLNHAQAMDIARRRLRRWGGWNRLKQRGKRFDWSMARGVPRTMERLSIRMKVADVGDVWWVRNLKTNKILAVRKIRVYKPSPVPPIPDSRATQDVKEIWAYLFTKVIPATEKHVGADLDFVFMGIFNCRYIDGTRTPSQHASYNALDWRLRRANGPILGIDVSAMDFAERMLRNRFPNWTHLWRVSGHYFHAHDEGAKIYRWPECM